MEPLADTSDAMTNAEGVLALDIGRTLLMSHLAGMAEVHDRAVDETVVSFSDRQYVRDGKGRFSRHGYTFKHRDPADVPEDEFVSRRELWKHERAPYVDAGDNVIASSRTTPQDYPVMPIGTWRIDDMKLRRGRDIEELREFDTKDLVPTEDPFSMGRGDDVERYARWHEHGSEFPPILALEMEDGRFSVADGHRRFEAAKRRGAKIRAWTSYLADVPGSNLPDGTPLRQSLTRELALVHKARREGSAIPTDIAERYPEIGRFSDAADFRVSRKARQLAEMAGREVPKILEAYVSKYGMNPEEQSTLVERYVFGRGFQLARTASEAIRRKARDLVMAAVTGIPEADVAALLGALRKRFTTSYVDTVLRTNITTAYSAGRFRALAEPEVAGKGFGLEYEIVDDEHTRDNHRAAEGVYARADSPVWDTLTPPLGYRCRCSLRIVSASEARRRKLRSASKAPSGAFPDEPGFGVRPGGI